MGLFNLRNIIFIVIVVAGFNFFNANEEIDVEALSLPLNTKVLAFGDSLTQGVGATSQASYPSVLAQILHVNVINAGLSGEMSEQGLTRLPLLLETHKPDILILCHGGNDILRNKDLSLLQGNLDKMIKMAQAKGIYVLLVGVPSMDVLTYRVPTFYYDVARENNVEIEDFSLPKVLNEDGLRSDRVHPNAQGYTLMAKHIAKLLSENYRPSLKAF